MKRILNRVNSARSPYARIIPGRWCPIAPKAPTKRKISWALQRAWAAVKIGMSNSGVPTNRTRSRQRSRIHGEGADAGEAAGGGLLAAGRAFRREIACV